MKASYNSVIGRDYFLHYYENVRPSITFKEFKFYKLLIKYLYDYNSNLTNKLVITLYFIFLTILVIDCCQFLGKNNSGRLLRISKFPTDSGISPTYCSERRTKERSGF